MKITTVDTPGGLIMVPYSVKRSRRARYLRLTMNPDRSVVVSIPGRTSEKEALRFLSDQGAWLADHLAPAPKKRRADNTLFRHFERKPWISVGGVRCDFDLGFTRERPQLRYDEDRFQIAASVNSRTAVEPQLKSLLRQLARSGIRDRAMELALSVEVSVSKVGVRDQTRCWGSCSHQRALSFNWRLLLLPPKLHDYIIYHELAHLTHMDHSASYWDLLTRYDRNARRNDASVSKASSYLMSLGRDG
jgi:hypothetical protein